MQGLMTRGREKSPDTSHVLTTLESMSHGDSQAAFLASRIAIGIERQTLPDDVVDTLSSMSPTALSDTIHNMSRSTVYDLPRRLIYALAQKFASPRPLHL